MKNILTLIFIILLGNCIVSAQEEIKSNYQFSVDNIKKIVITTDGYIEIENSIFKKVDCELCLTKKGRVIGFSNEDELPDPKLTSNIKDSILYIELEKRPELYVIGISTYSEKLTINFKVPNVLPVDVINLGKSYIRGSFKQLILDSSLETELWLDKSRIKYLDCVSLNHEVKIDGIEKGSHFIYEGNGTETYSIKSSTIKIKFE